MQQNLWLEGLFLYKAGKLWKTVSKADGVCKHVQKLLTSPETTLCYQEQRVAGWGLRLGGEEGSCSDAHLPDTAAQPGPRLSWV